jgi:hypothetical protein
LNGSAYALRGYGVTLGSSFSHAPFFSRKAAFLLDTMAALPRKWVSGGAPTLPRQTFALTR